MIIGQTCSQGTRVGILGTGKMGLYHGNAIEYAGGQVVAGSAQSSTSRSWEVFRKQFPEATFCTPQELLDSSSVDKVVVSLPWYTIAEWLPTLLRSPKPMLIEKPLSLKLQTLQQAMAMPGIFYTNKTVGFNRRFYRTVNRLSKRIVKGGLKEVSATISEDVGKHVRSYGREILPHLFAFDSVHTLDLLFYLLGTVEIVRVYASQNKSWGSSILSYNGLLEAIHHRIPVSLNLNIDDPSPAGIRCRFDDGTTWVLEPIETLTVYDRYEIQEPTAEDPIRRYRPHAVETIEESRDNKPGFNAQMEAFLQDNARKSARVQDSVTLLKFIEQLQTGAYNSFQHTQMEHTV